MVTLLREPVSRTLSEFRHVCSAGTGQWDYSTRAWRSSNVAHIWSDGGIINSQNYKDAVKATNALFSGANQVNHAKGSSADKLWSYDYNARNCSSGNSLVSFLSNLGHVNGMRNRQTKMLAGALLDPHVAERRSDKEL